MYISIRGYACPDAINPSNKYNIALDKHTRKCHLVIEMGTEWSIVGYGTDVLWDLCNVSVIFTAHYDCHYDR